MKPLIVLLLAFGVSAAAFYLLSGSLKNHQWSRCGCIAMGVMMLFTGIAHFKITNGMANMLPAFIPFKKELVLLTGVVEILAGIGLLLPAWQKVTGWWLIVFFVLILPANISAAMRHINIEKGTADGPGPAYLWFRVPLQILFIAWVYFFAIVLP